MSEHPRADSTWEVLVTAGHMHQGHKVIPTLLAVALKCFAECTPFPRTAYQHVLTVLPTSLKETEVAFQETAIMIFFALTQLRMQESECQTEGRYPELGSTCQHSIYPGPMGAR